MLGARHAPPAAHDAPRLRRPPCRPHPGPPAQRQRRQLLWSRSTQRCEGPSRERARRHVVGQVAGQHHRACRGAWWGGASLGRVILGCVSDALDLDCVMGHSLPPAVTSNSKRDPSFPRPVAAPAWMYVSYREARGLPTPTHTMLGRLDQQSRHWARRRRDLAHESTGLPTEVMPVVVAVVVPRKQCPVSSLSWHGTQLSKHHCCRCHPRGAMGGVHSGSRARPAQPLPSACRPPWRGAGTLEPVLNSR